MFEPRSFGSKFTVLKKVLATLLGLFGARVIVPPLPPLVTPMISPFLHFLNLLGFHNLCSRASFTFGAFEHVADG